MLCECSKLDVRRKWLLICSCNSHKNSMSNYLMNFSKIIDRNSSRYHKYLCIGDFNSDTSELHKEFSVIFINLGNLVREPTCF